MRKLGNIVIILLLTSLGDALTNKIKSCVEFRVRNSRWNHDVLAVSEDTSEYACQWQCARHPNCRAYNLWRNGTCELVHGMGVCNEVEEQEQCTYVHLGECTGRVPWDVGRRNWSADAPCLTWQQLHAGGDCPSSDSDVLTIPASSVCIALVPHKGLYLPGRYVRAKKFKTILETAEPLSDCNNHGYFLRVGCPTRWQSYNAGDDLPIGAVRISSWTDGSPLYLVASEAGRNSWEPGYYHVSRQQAFVLQGGELRIPTTMSILVYNWRHVFSTDIMAQHIVCKMFRINGTGMRGLKLQDAINNALRLVRISRETYPPCAQGYGYACMDCKHSMFGMEAVQGIGCWKPNCTSKRA